MRPAVFPLVAALASTSSALDNGLALAPPMGFANWNGFGCNYNDTTFRQQADYLNSSGLAALGYRTMIIQECITLAGHRAPDGTPQPDPKKFPHGIKGLCDYIHTKGLLCGIYTDVGPKTCAGWEGSFNHDEIDAKTYAGAESVPGLPAHAALTRLLVVAAACRVGHRLCRGRLLPPR
jgi:alpha-galactosidase